MPRPPDVITPFTFQGMDYQAGITELSLFSGYGGFSLALQLLLGRKGVRTIGYCEIEPYCQEILKARIRDGYLDDAPIWPDIRTADFSGLRGMVDIVTAGFPCQPHSIAGKRKGKDDARNLWPQTAAVIDAVRPCYVFLENVPGLLQSSDEREPYVVTILGDLAKLGYDAKWGVLGARDVGAPHRRDRWWCLAYATGQRRDRRLQESEGQYQEMGWIQYVTHDGSAGMADSQGEQGDGSEPGIRPATVVEAQPRGLGSGLPQWPPIPGDSAGWARVLAEHPELAPALAYSKYRHGEQPAGNLTDNSIGEGRAGSRDQSGASGGGDSRSERITPQSTIRGVADGPKPQLDASHRTQRLKALGNGIVPLQAAVAFGTLLAEMQV